MKPTYILGIDTSFDDTAASVTCNSAILSNVLSSQLPMYQEWGGVVPRLARQSHVENIDAVISLALKRAHCPIEKIDAIAVTQGPGLAIALEVGIAKAKELALTFHKPLIAINHMEGHLLSCLASPNSRKSDVRISMQKFLPAMAVLVSGGHTQFILASKIGTYEIVGETQDDAMGEAFDKVGRMLGLGYPAGALVEKLATGGIATTVTFPVPMRGVKSADTSFSGLKTAASRIIEAVKREHGGELTKQDIASIAHGFQKACITHLCEKLDFALQKRSVKSIILGGGVAANTEVRKMLRSIANKYNVPLFLPYTKKLCVDNGAMIALAGYFKYKKSEFVQSPQELERIPTMRL